MAATSRTVIRMWNKDGYHKDVVVLDSDQIRWTDGRVKEASSFDMLSGIGIGQSVVINPADFPEAVCFQIIAQEYPKR